MPESRRRRNSLVLVNLAVATNMRRNDGNFSLLPRLSRRTTHLPAFAVLREIAGFGIVRATRGNHSRCRPIFGACRNLPGGGEGVFMESGDGARVEAANTPALAGFNPYGGSDSICCSGLVTVGNRGGALVDLNVTAEMKIIQFPVNIDKLTSYFDKYLKIKPKDEEIIYHYNSIIYVVILKYKINILSNFIELKKILRPPHFPAIARICARA